MLDFRPLVFEDREKVIPILRSSGFRGCEYSFANNLAWQRLADSRIAFYQDFYIVCAFGNEDGIPAFIFPSGKGDLTELIGVLKRFSEDHDSPLKLSGVTENQLAVLSEFFPGQFDSVFDRDGSDYIYRVSNLTELAGRKYHGKRNHLSRFRELDYTYSPITEADYDECIVFCTEAYNGRTAESAEEEHSFAAEQYAINTFFNHFEGLGLRGGIIRIDGSIAAVTIGEPLTDDTFCVHIEKADTAYNGIYTGICNCFARAEMGGFEYVNREEDLGIEGLRRSKLSYHPAYLLNKYIITFR
ncbi:MAG: DUF2156 domain-containing protein [Ruminococcus sp.]|nr:DUF2156 domain-containing protein [Ruminococcus sp.]